MKVWVVDAFTDQPYAGNPAGVIIVEEFPNDKHCQLIAAEINLSETAFVKPLAQDHFHIRWFTPLVEVKLCGHASLAAAHILHQQGRVSSDTLQFNSLSGPLYVYKKEMGLTLDFPLQSVGPVLATSNYQQYFNVPIVTAIQAFDDVIVELPDESSVRQLQIIPEQILAIECRGLIVTAKADEGSPYDFISRFFAPRVGVNEDPVTGSAHCKLADYWCKKLGKTNFRAFQASKRSGEIQLDIHDSRVYLTGQAVTVFCGDWLVFPLSQE